MYGPRVKREVVADDGDPGAMALADMLLFFEERVSNAELSHSRTNKQAPPAGQLLRDSNLSKDQLGWTLTRSAQAPS